MKKQKGSLTNSLSPVAQAGESSRLISDWLGVRLSLGGHVIWLWCLMAASMAWDHVVKVQILPTRLTRSV